MPRTGRRMRSQGGASAVLLLAAAVVLGPIADGAGGGSIANTLPTVASFSRLVAGERSVGSTEVFAALVDDRNGEEDIVRLRLSTTSGPAVSLEHVVTAAERAASAKPSAFASGWKVWNPTSGDGKLSVEVQATLTSAGSHVWQFAVQDEAAYQTGPAPTISFAVTETIRVATDPVGPDGLAQTAARWGAWLADPGATDVVSSNYLRVENGPNATQSFTLDFTEPAFNGTLVAAKTIPIDGNIRFAWWEDTTPATTSPAEGSFAFGAPSTDGSLTAAFTGAGNVIYVRYQIVALPETLLDQTYEASLTVTAA